MRAGKESTAVLHLRVPFAAEEGPAMAFSKTLVMQGSPVRAVAC
jgi:hypothetical protein